MPITEHQVEQAIMVIEKRLNSMGTAEPLIARQGTDGILVQMPGVTTEESDKIRTTLEKVAKLELREVSPRNDEVGADGKTLAAAGVRRLGESIPGYRAFNQKSKDQDGKEFQPPDPAQPPHGRARRIGHRRSPPRPRNRTTRSPSPSTAPAPTK